VTATLVAVADNRPALVPLYDAANCLSSAAILTETDGDPQLIRTALAEAMSAAEEYGNIPHVQAALMTLIHFARDVHEAAAT
jgi:hypothetical protein